MWQHVLENTLPALVGAGAVGLVFGLTRQRPAAWIVLMVLMIALIAASTQIVWEIFPQWHDGLAALDCRHRSRPCDCSSIFFSDEEVP
jgi:hypothetical protein